jgi:drug/metabolite transporter (DMT)-like permease
VLEQPLTGYPAQTYWSLIGVALITQVGAYLAISYALGHLPASIVSPTLLGQPVLTALLAVPLLGQPLNPAQIVGGAVVLAGIWIVHRQRG